MERDTAQNQIAALLRDDPELAELLPGGVWTRRIKPNRAPAGAPPTPGSTPEAFDEKGRIRPCASVLPGGPRSRNPLGPGGAYYGFPEAYFRCLPHEGAKRALHAAMDRATALIEGAVVAGTAGEGLLLRVGARVEPDDDDDLPPAVVGMVQVQIDSVWPVARRAGTD